MKKYLFCLLAAMILLTGCGKAPAPTLIAQVDMEVDAQALDNISLTLPEGISRETVSGIQHDFVQDGKQVGGIVIVDITGEMLDAPYDNLLRISDSLAQQVLNGADPKNKEFVGAGGNPYAYMELYHGAEDSKYVHCLFRGQAYRYDVWFDMDAVQEETRNGILSSLSSDDITASNKSPF